MAATTFSFANASNVRADEPSKADLTVARSLFAEAVADEDAGRWADALSKIRRAGAVKMTPGIRFHIAVCEEKLAQLVPALEDYTAAQVAAQRENNREVLDLVGEPLLALKARIPTLKVDVPAGVQGIDVRLDGRVLQASLWGTAFPVDAGAHKVEARAPGMTPYTSTVTLAPRETTSVVVSLVPLPPTPPVVAPLAAPSTEAAPERRPRTLAIAATASAAVLVGVGVGAYVVAGSDQSSDRSRCSGLISAAQCGGQTAIRAWDATALVSWIAATGVATAAVVLWARPATADHTPAHAELGLGPGTVSLAGSF